jgi:hypothetical protein
MVDQTIAKPLGLIKDLKNSCSWNSLCNDFYYDLE